MLFGYSQDHVDRKVRDAKEEGRQTGLKSREDEVKQLKENERTLKQDHEHKLKDLNKDHELKLKEKEFEIKHLADERVKKAEDEATKLREELAVSKKENEMLGKITDLNADVIDVKKLVGDLINKLPTVNINAGISTGPAPKEQKKDN